MFYFFKIYESPLISKENRSNLVLTSKKLFVFYMKMMWRIIDYDTYSIEDWFLVELFCSTILDDQRKEESSALNIDKKKLLF